MSRHGAGAATCGRGAFLAGAVGQALSRGRKRLHLCATTVCWRTDFSSDRSSLGLTDEHLGLVRAPRAASAEVVAGSPRRGRCAAPGQVDPVSRQVPHWTTRAMGAQHAVATPRPAVPDRARAFGLLQHAVNRTRGFCQSCRADHHRVGAVPRHRRRCRQSPAEGRGRVKSASRGAERDQAGRVHRGAAAGTAPSRARAAFTDRRRPNVLRLVRAAPTVKTGRADREEHADNRSALAERFLQAHRTRADAGPGGTSRRIRGTTAGTGSVVGARRSRGSRALRDPHPALDSAPTLLANRLEPCAAGCGPGRVAAWIAALRPSSGRFGTRFRHSTTPPPARSCGRT